MQVAVQRTDTSGDADESISQALSDKGPWEDDHTASNDHVQRIVMTVRLPSCLCEYLMRVSLVVHGAFSATGARLRA